MIALAWALGKKGLSKSTRLVLIALANRANDATFECFPGHKKIAADAEVSVTAVKSALTELIGAGLVRVTHRTRLDGKSKTSNRYQLLVDTVHKYPDGQISIERAMSNEEHPIVGNRLRPWSETDQHNNSNTSKEVNSTSRDKSLSVRRGKEEVFPKPEGVDPEVWRDFLINRKQAKNGRGAPNTATAYRMLMGKAAAIAKRNPKWTIPKLFEHAAGKGWIGIYEPSDEDSPRTNGADPKEHWVSMSDLP